MKLRSISVDEAGASYINLPNGFKKKISGVREELHIEVVEAKELPQMDVGADVSDEERAAGVGITCDSFVTVQVGDQVRKTRVIRDSLTPIFKESFFFILSDPTNMQDEIIRQMMNIDMIKIEVFDWDADESCQLVRKVDIPLHDVAKKNENGLYCCLDFWLVLKDDNDQVPPPKQDCSAGRGQLRIRAAVRAGIQVEILRRLTAGKWLEDSKLIDALSRVPTLFCPGDQGMVRAIASLVKDRGRHPVSLSAEHFRMTKEIGIPLGIAGKALNVVTEPVGLRLLHMIRMGIPLKEAALEDPRDVIHMTMETHFQAKAAAAHALGHLASPGDEDALLALLDLIEDESDAVRENAAWALAKVTHHGDNRVVRALIQRLADESRNVRRTAARSLRYVALHDDHNTICNVCNHLDDLRDGVRSAARKALKDICSPNSITAVVEACARLESPVQCVRISAVTSILLIFKRGDSRVIAEIVNRLQHPIESVRLFAVQALSDFAGRGNKFAVAAVGNLLEHPDWQVRRNAVEALLAISHPGDAAIIHVVSKRLLVDSETESVLEGAKYIIVPTNEYGEHFRNGSQNFERKNHAGNLYTPRLPFMLPLLRPAAVSLHLPFLPSDPSMPSVAHMWWKDKHSGDSIRHRYDFMNGVENKLALWDVSKRSTIETNTKAGKSGFEETFGIYLNPTTLSDAHLLDTDRQDEDIMFWRTTGTLCIKIKAARSLPILSKFGSCDAFVSVDILPNKPINTRILLNSQNPEWEEEFSFFLDGRMLINVDKTSATATDFAAEQSCPIPEADMSKLGLYFDFKVCLPCSETEFTKSSRQSCRQSIGEITQVEIKNVEILSENQVSMRSRILNFRIHISTYFQMLEMAEKVSEQEVSDSLQSAGLIDEHRALQVQVEHLTTKETLLRDSSHRVVFTVWHHNLGTENRIIGFVELPLLPLINSLREVAEGFNEWFLIEGAEDLDSADHGLQDPAMLHLHLTFWPDVKKIHTSSQIASERSKSNLSAEIRKTAVQALSDVCGNHHAIAAKQIMRCFEKHSLPVQESAKDAMLRISNPKHSMSVNQVVWWPNEDKILSCAMDGTIKIWDVQSGRVQTTFRFHKGPIYAMALHPDQKNILVSSGADGYIRISDIVAGEEILAVKISKEDIRLLALSISGSMIAAYTTSFSVKDYKVNYTTSSISLWSTSLPPKWIELHNKLRNEHVLLAQILANFCEKAKIDREYECAYPLIERIVAIGASSSQVMEAMRNISEKLSDKHFSNYKEIALQTVQALYDCLSSKSQPELPTWSKALFMRVRRDLRMPALNKVAHFKGQDEPRLFDFREDSILCLQFDPQDAGRLATGSSDGILRIWQMPCLSPLEVESYEAQSTHHSKCLIQKFRAHGTAVLSLIYHPKHEHILFTCSQTVKIWSTLTSKCLGSLAHMDNKSSKYFAVLGICNELDSVLAAGTDGGTVVLWQIDFRQYHDLVKSTIERNSRYFLGSDNKRIKCHVGPVTSISINSSKLLGISSSADRSIALWDVVSGNLLKVLNDSVVLQGIVLNTVTETILEGLEHEDFHVRDAATQCLLQTTEKGDPPTILLIIKNLENTRSEVRDSALTALKQIAVTGDLQATIAVARLLMNTNSEIRESARIATAFVLDDDMSRGILMEIADRLNQTRSTALETFTSVAAEMILVASDKLTLSEEEMTGFLLRWDKQPDWGVRLMRMTALQCLLQALQVRSHEKITLWFRHPDADIRLLAVRTMSELSDSAANAGIRLFCNLLPTPGLVSGESFNHALSALSSCLLGILLRRVESSLDGQWAD